MKTQFTKLFLTALTVCLAGNVMAQTVPALVNYQGRLAGADGAPLPTQEYTLTFRVFDSATNSGGLVWGPQIFDGVAGQGRGGKIPVVQGYFNVMLGPVDTNGVSLDSAFNATNRYVEIRVGTNNPIFPRQQILSAPYAFQAGNSGKLAGADWSAVFGTNDPVDGKIPTTKLATNGTILVQQIGVATGSPGSEVDVNGQVRANRFRAQSVVGEPTFLSTSGTSGEEASFGWVSSGFTAIQSGVWGTDPRPLVIQGGGGNLGVGKVPTTPLDVNGTVKATSFTGSGAGITSLNGSNLVARIPTASAPVGGLAQSGSSGLFSVNSSSYTDIQNFSLNLVTTGRPVVVTLAPDLGGDNGGISNGYINLSSSGNCDFLLLRNTVAITKTWFQGSAPGAVLSLPGSAIVFLDTPPAGTNTYKLQVKSAGATVLVRGLTLIAYEL